MTLNIHPSAANNFNNKARDFLDFVTPFHPTAATTHGFSSDLHIAATLTEKDLACDVDELDVSSTDYKGQIVARYFLYDNCRHGIDGGNYQVLSKMAEQIQLLPCIKGKLSKSFIEKTLFSWIKAQYKKTLSDKPFIQYLDEEASKAIEKRGYWIPIANLEVEVPFSVSMSEIRPLSKAVIDYWEAQLSPTSPEHGDMLRKYFEQIRKDYQGLAAAYMVIEAEPDHAFSCAIREAQEVTSILGIFSSATLIPDIKCASTIKGSEHICRATAFIESNAGIIRSKGSILDVPSAQYWRLGKRDIEEISKSGLHNLSVLMSKKERNDFEDSVLASVSLYSKSAFTSDPVEKVVYMLSALESILLKNSNEPIQQNLAERLAVFTAQELAKRKSIISTVKAVYSVRSRYLHHGHTSSELALISEFMMCVWTFFMQLIANLGRFTTKEVFISAIDDHKLG